MKKIIFNILDKLLAEFNLPDGALEVLNSNKAEEFDYSSNFPLKLIKLKKVDSNPELIANKYIETILKDHSNVFEKIYFSKPGFVNFKFKNEFLVGSLVVNYLNNFKYDRPQGKFLNYEFVSANPTGWLHIGHARNAFVGDVSVRTLEYLGNKVDREFYINDAGNQIEDLAKAVRFYIERAEQKLSFDNLTEQEAEAVPYKGKEIKQFAKELHKSGNYNYHDHEAFKLICSNHFLNEIKKTLAKLNIGEFKYWYSEKSLYQQQIDKQVISQLEKTGKVYQSEGATFLKTTDALDDKDRVLVKSDGTTTYVMGDIAYHWVKTQRGYDKLIDLWGYDHKGYEKRIQSALSFLGYPLDKVEMDFMNMVQVSADGAIVKMSKRAGTSVTINEVVEMMEQEDMSADVLRFFLLLKSKEQGIEIDFKLMQEKSMENPYFYVQYASARLSQLILKYKDQGNELLPITTNHKFELLAKEPKERELILKALEFDDYITQAGKNREPLILINFIKELSKSFHSYYNNSIVIGNDKELSSQRVSLMLMVKELFNFYLSTILGIKPLDKM